MGRWIEPLGRALAILIATMPFAFALIRALRTGSDVRYIWVALASLAGAGAVLKVGRSYGRTLPFYLALSGAVFVAATLSGISAALLLGTKLGLGILIVGASFGLCFAVSCLFLALVRLRKGVSGI